MRVQQWHEHFEGLPSEEVLRQKFKAPEYRVSSSTYQPNVRFAGTMAGGTTYVLKGACRYTIKGEVVTLHEGEFCQTPGGDYDFEVVGAGEVIAVKIWHMPTLVARAGIPWSSFVGSAG